MTNIVEQVQKISLKAEHIKVTLYQAIHREYNDLLPSKSQHELLKTLKPLLAEVKKLEDKFENDVKEKVKAATIQHKDLVDEFNRTKLATEFLQKICLCHSELTACKLTETNQFMKCANHLQVVKRELESLSSSISDIKIFKAIKNEYINQHTRIVNSINEVWSSVILWNVSPNISWDSLDSHLKTSLKIDIQAAGSHVKLSDVFQAMESLQSLHPKLKILSQKLFTYLLKPLVKFQSLVPVIEGKENSCNILKFTKKKTTDKRSAKVNVLLYGKIMEVIKFINKSLFSVAQDESNEDLKPMSTIGSLIWQELSEAVIKDHLATAVPKTNSQMEKYESTIEETLKFESDLKEQGFIPVEEEILSKYIKDVNIHFANKICQDILSEARDIILTEMHNTTEVGILNDRASIPIPKDTDALTKKIKNMLIGFESVDDELLVNEVMNTFSFPSCYITDNVQKLMDFIYRTMVKATESPYPIACQLVCSCRDVFELFVSVVPVYHQEDLKLPQLAALHYNNSMYLAHHCITLGHQFQSSMSGQLNSPITSFVDLVPVLRKCGTDIFLDQLRSQQKELLALLEPCEQFTQVTTINGNDIVKRSFNQIIHHLTRVAKQWYKILPINIFKQSISVLINTVLEACINAVLKMEDISVDEAGQLHKLFKILIDRIPEIIKFCAEEDFEISERVRSYTKFEHILRLLEASLQEIVDSWNNGEGSLSLCMTENDVRTMIRALFQNTDRRSQALSKIKHHS